MTERPGDLRLQSDGEGVVFWIHVTPRARKPGVGGLRGDALRVAVGAPALEGRANAACIAALAQALSLRPAALSIDPGSRSRRKRVRAEGDATALGARVRRLAELKGLE